MDSLDELAFQCLRTCDPEQKVALTRALFARFREQGLTPRHARAAQPAETVAGRPARPRLVSPRALPRRGLGTPEGRAALLHAVAHIEFNAINLALDAVYRFAGMPLAYYKDWLRVADDEARHFTMVSARLADHGLRYGDLDAHDGLWEMACRTQHDCLTRMALVPRVLEARGLDVTPGMIERLRAAGDSASAEMLGVILREETAHVAAGSHWFAWCCARAGCEPQVRFRELLAEYMRVAPQPPFNRVARLEAGFSAAELDALEAEA